MHFRVAGLLHFSIKPQRKDHMKNSIIEVPVTELRTALPGLSKIIGRSRSVLPVLQSVRVARNQAGTVTLEATDLDSLATFTLKDKSEGPPTQLLVPFERLQKAVKQTNGKLELSLNGKDELTVRTFWRDTPMEEKVHVPYHDDWPKMPGVEDKGIVLDETFRDTFKEAIECASVDESRQVINSVYLDVEDKKGHYVVSTDGRILFSANSFSFAMKESIAVPTRKFLSWSGWWNEGNALLCVKAPANDKETHWIKISADQWTFVTKGIEAKYPKWKECVPTDKPKTRITLPQSAIDGVLEVIARLPGEDLPYHDITLNVAKNTLVLQGRSKESDKPVAVPIVEAQVEGPSIIIAVDRFNLVKALRFGLNQIDLIDELSPLVVRNGGKRMIIMPIRPAASAAPKVQPQPPAPTTSTATTPAQPTEPVQLERTTMPRQTTVAPVNGEQQESPLKQLIQQIENIKDTLKGVIGELNTALDVVKKAEKEKRITEKEIETIRGKVRDIQSVSI
jgi:DNA polymerase III sliding clamp (beta) subunit (PCNA family)